HARSRQLERKNTAERRNRSRHGPSTAEEEGGRGVREQDRGIGPGEHHSIYRPSAEVNLGISPSQWSYVLSSSRGADDFAHSTTRGTRSDTGRFELRQRNL